MYTCELDNVLRVPLLESGLQSLYVPNFEICSKIVFAKILALGPKFSQQLHVNQRVDFRYPAASKHLAENHSIAVGILC